MKKVLLYFLLFSSSFLHAQFYELGLGGSGTLFHGDVGAVVDNRACARLRAAAYRHHQRRLAGSVGADQCYDLAAIDVDIDATQRDDLAVIGLDTADRKQWGLRCRAHFAPPVLPLLDFASVFACFTHSSRSMRPGKAR